MITRSNRELWLAFAAIIAISLMYVFTTGMLGGIPPAREFFGHSIGIVGFLLMLMTETLYTLRKRSRSARWGRMSSWLDFHIFTGVVGPFLVLLHTSWRFNGLAGIVLLLTVIIVISGFIGRYIYTAVPRTADGVELEASFLAKQITETDAEMQRWIASEPEKIRQLTQRLVAKASNPAGGALSIFNRTFSGWIEALRWRQVLRKLDAPAQVQVRQLEKLLRRKSTLSRQISSLAMARRLLALWHAVHIPIGMVLFTAAFIHIAAAIYYATLLR